MALIAGNFLSSASHVLSFIHSHPHLSASDGSIVYSIRGFTGLKLEAGPRFLSFYSLALFSTLSKHTTKNCLTLSTMSSVPTTLYGIHRNDDPDPHQDFTAPLDASSSMHSGEPFHPTPFDGVSAPSFPNPSNISATLSHEEQPAFPTNGATGDACPPPVFTTSNTVPYFQTPFPFAMTSSPFFSGVPTSPAESALPPSPSPPRGKLPKRKPNAKDVYTKRITANLAKSKRVANTRHARGPTRTTGFQKTFVRSFHPVLEIYVF